MSATPVIDTKSPPYRGHVAVKLKKLQKENERSQRIERDNLILLQKLNHIMTTHWLDNYLPPQPTFLSRVGIYRPLDSGIDMDDTSKGIDLESQERDLSLDSMPKCRKLNCVACSPNRFKEPTVQIPEERIPWEPPRQKIGKRRSSSVPPKRKPETLTTVSEKPKSASSLDENKRTLRAKNNEKPKTEPSAKKVDKLNPANLLIKQTHSISISRGSLKLSINFPRDTVVKFDKKRIGQDVCRCSRGVQQ